MIGKGFKLDKDFYSQLLQRLDDQRVEANENDRRYGTFTRQTLNKDGRDTVSLFSRRQEDRYLAEALP